MLFTYNCKKTGQSVDVEVESLPKESMEYAIRRGLREYFDNYHASETLKAHDGDPAKLAAAVAPMVEEARDRLLVGDVPGTREPADPRTAFLRKVVKEIGEVDITTINPEKLAQWLKRQAESGRAA